MEAVNGGWWVEDHCVFNLRIPEIDDETLSERYPRIQPILRDKDGVAWFIEEVAPSEIAFMWSPVFREKAPELVEIGRVERVYVPWAYYGFFKPTIRDCLAQMPDHVVADCVAFEIVKYPGHANDLNEEKEALNAGYHVCEVVYYGRAS